MRRFGHYVVDASAPFPPGSAAEWVRGDPKFAAAGHSSDYCYWDCESPDSANDLEARDDLGPGGQEPLFAGTGTRFYNLQLVTGDPT